ncbi:MAG TPA: response regulator [Nocardioidaceae bacterium]|jgi:CheY-like chemotaxis protein|nr:response regulator [Nocardioidaceae bacterium]
MSDRARILLVDDRTENLLALEAILSSLNQLLVRATSGEEALRALLKDEYALILLDVQMPGMDGFETAAQIKARSRTRDIPIIFLTAVDTDERNAYRGYAAGGADYITKPFDPWVLRAKVQVFVDLWVAGRRLATQADFLRRQLGEGESSAIDVLGELRDRLTGVEESVQALTDELRDPEAGSPDETLEALERRVASMRQALDVLDGSSVSGLTRREFG